MAFGLGVLRLSPDAFWAMSPRELAAAAEGVRGPAPQGCEGFDLDALLRAFPDDKDMTHGG
jgi:uncharacterized phage protein (TIGR02216 family)